MDSDDSDSKDSDDSMGSDEDSSDSDDDSSESDDAMSDTLSKAMSAALKFGGVLNATSTLSQPHIAKTCPVGFNAKLGTCWAQCPYSFPVQCGMECTRQNDDCALEIVTKVSALAQTTLSLITYDVFGKLSKLARAVQVVIKCAKYTMGLIKALANRQRRRQYPHRCVVLHRKIASDEIKFVDSVLMTAEYVLKEVVANGAAMLSSWEKFTGS
ncbi:hypothetical protein PInf_011741 [Phytophthora infestans]|nr:hypothetical protein PInf_011741 [Phytophthora infestans]